MVRNSYYVDATSAAEIKGFMGSTSSKSLAVLVSSFVIDVAYFLQSGSSCFDERKADLFNRRVILEWPLLVIARP